MIGLEISSFRGGKISKMRGITGAGWSSLFLPAPFLGIIMPRKSYGSLRFTWYLLNSFCGFPSLIVCSFGCFVDFVNSAWIGLSVFCGIWGLFWKSWKLDWILERRLENGLWDFAAKKLDFDDLVMCYFCFVGSAELGCWLIDSFSKVPLIGYIGCRLDYNLVMYWNFFFWMN